MYMLYFVVREMNNVSIIFHWLIWLHEVLIRFVYEVVFDFIILNENEWVSDCCLTPIQQFFSYIMTRTN
jgi:hypothetical protein